MKRVNVISIVSLVISIVALALISITLPKRIERAMEKAMNSATEKRRPFISTHQEYPRLSDSAMRQTITTIGFESKVVSDIEVSDINDSFRKGLLNTGLFDVVDRDSMLTVDKITAGEIAIAYGKTYTIMANMKDVKTGEIVALGQVFVNDKKEFVEKAKQLAVLLTNQIKIKRILKEFEEVDSYTYDNALVKQIAEIGDDAIQPLLDQLDDTAPHQWAKEAAIGDALNMLLAKDHKEIILKIFKEKDVCSKLIKKYKFPEAEDIVMDKIKYGRHVDNNVIDTALILNKKRAVPLLINYASSSTNPVYAAQKLAEVPFIDIKEILRKAARNARGVWTQSGLAKLMIERGMKEGLDIAIQVLRSAQEHSKYNKQKVAEVVRVYTGAKGDYNEMAAWLEKNKDSLKWNEEYRRFK